ncbi:MAG: hypothetical protein WBF71_09150, partial [Microthrixaceae bacterium]
MRFGAPEKDVYMCGIIAVVRRRSSREPVPAGPFVDELAAVCADLRTPTGQLNTVLGDAADRLEVVNTALSGVPGLLSLMRDTDAARLIAARIGEVAAAATAIETTLDRPSAELVGDGMSVAQLELTNAALIRCKDAIWAIQRDRLRAAAEVLALSPEPPGDAGAGVLFSLHQALSAIDRLEVRGRDSAGVEVQLSGHGLD